MSQGEVYQISMSAAPPAASSSCGGAVPPDQLLLAATLAAKAALIQVMSVRACTACDHAHPSIHAHDIISPSAPRHAPCTTCSPVPLHARAYTTRGLVHACKASTAFSLVNSLCRGTTLMRMLQQLCKSCSCHQHQHQHHRPHSCSCMAYGCSPTRLQPPSAPRRSSL